MRKLRIAIDIDNTLINYEELFAQAAKLEGLESNLKTKDQIKNHIKEQEANWPSQWIRIQGQCYGNLIEKAPYYKNALKVISSLIDSGHHIELVSHKSKMSFCNRFNLHKACLNRIESDFEIINFFETRKEKTTYVNESSFDLMIDDLSEVLDDIESNILPIHFNSKPSTYLQAHNWNEIEEVLNFISLHEINNINKVGKQTFQLKNSNKDYYIKKFLDNDRFNNELITLRALKTITNPSFIFPHVLTQGNNTLLYEDAKTERISFNKTFITAYKTALTEINKTDIDQLATHAAVLSSDFLKNIENRLEIYNYSNKENLLKIFNYLKPKSNNSEKLELIVCQPDMLRDNFGIRDGLLCFFDFESFGKDALIRPVLNAIHHNGHNITDDEAINLFHAHKELANNQALYKEQFLQFFDHNALEWLIIMSNKAYSGNDDQLIQLVQQQTEKMIYNLENNKSVLSWKGELYDRILKSI